MSVKHALAIAGVTLDPAEDHLMANGAMQNVVREVVGDIGLKLYRGTGRKRIPPLPVDDDLHLSAVVGRITTIS